MRLERTSVFAILLVLVASSASAEELSWDFRAGQFDSARWSLVGQRTEQLVKLGREGLGIELPGGPKKLPATGLASTFTLDGNFEVTLSLQALIMQTPEAGYGAGVGLYVMSEASPTRDAASLNRVRLTDGTEVYTTFVGRTAGKGRRQRQSQTFRSGLPAPGSSGQIRVARTGERLSFAVSTAPRSTFRVLAEVDFPTTPITLVRIAADPGGSRVPVAARFETLTIKADRVGPRYVPASASRSRWMWLAALPASVCLAAVGFCWIIPHRRRASRQPGNSTAETNRNQGPRALQPRPQDILPGRNPTSRAGSSRP